MDRARRPIMHLVNGLITNLAWPSIELLAGTDAHGHDLLLLVGAEPDFEWRAFSEAVLDLALEFGCRMVVGLGAYPAPVPHTRDVLLMGASPPRAELLAELRAAGLRTFAQLVPAYDTGAWLREAGGHGAGLLILPKQRVLAQPEARLIESLAVPLLLLR